MEAGERKGVGQRETRREQQRDEEPTTSASVQLRERPKPRDRTPRPAFRGFNVFVRRIILRYDKMRLAIH